jgi:phytoene/squalene synthetase
LKQKFDILSFKISELTTKSYSTSFSIGIHFLHKEIHEAIYAIYGFVRFADEIVDSFHEFDKEALLEEFKKDTYRAIEQKISLNPILNAFQFVVRKYNIDNELIEAFLHSMEMDLKKIDYSDSLYKEYIFGSAEVVGLMCLKVFTNGEASEYNKLKPMAQKLGSAFQKINFLRDCKADIEKLGRVYFPNVKGDKITESEKLEIEADIEQEFYDSLQGIKSLPENSKLGVYVAYIYYYQLLVKIKNVNANDIMQQRIRVSNFEKCILLIKAYLKYKLNWM